jgi:RNA polymerase sigma factor (TIGR02999 family)
VPDDQPTDVTVLLQRAREGDEQAEGEVWALIYDSLRDIAHRLPVQRDLALSATEIVNDAWFKLAAGVGTDIAGSSHYKAIAARAMRQVIIDRWRHEHRDKGFGGKARHEADGLVARFDHKAVDVMALHDALEDLEQNDPKLAKVVEGRFFGGMSYDELAVSLDIPVRTAQRYWQMARGYLRSKLEEGDA